MNTPNKLTVFRIALVPIFLFFLFSSFISLNYLWALIIFSVASYTDYLDGKIARKRGLVTNFGKFLDPLADKVLVISALVVFVELKLISAVVVIVLLTREFLVMGVRLLAATGGKVVPASFWAKMKTASQMIAIIIVILIAQFASSGIFSDVFNSQNIAIISEILMWITCVFSVVSGVQYVTANLEFINQMK
ncbi:MAG: CDP-diacylglycerol--glycerol-3-phosphate 3-phosphatidyltransferase [Clostridia bacterium]